MSKVLFAFVIGLAFCVPLAATAQAQSRLGPSEEDAPAVSATPAIKSDAKKSDAKREAAKTEAPAVVAATPKPAPTTEARRDEAKGAQAKSDAQKTPTVLSSAAAPNASLPTSTPPTTTSDGAPKSSSSTLPVFGSPSVLSIPTPPKYEPPAPSKTRTEPAAATTAATTAAPATATTTPAGTTAAASLSPTALYRVGVGDILDIRLAGGMSRDSTLYTVMSTGMLDYPLAGEPINVVGMTTDEIGARLAAELKRRAVYDRAQFRINVREYASHTATVSGLVDLPGAKILRREAVPLYVVLSEANPRAEAGRAVIISRATGRSKTIDLSDSAALNELISHGDIINITARPQEFFYVGGQINAPGQKDFHPGMTLTQALLASGGVARDAGAKVKVTVSRQGADGRLVATEYLLNDIETGQIPDPRLQAGDRVEVGRRR
jgi:protein involved in polysaccharide export with SLBB domain